MHFSDTFIIMLILLVETGGETRSKTDGETGGETGAETELKQMLKTVLFTTLLWYNQGIRKLWCLYLCAIKGGCGYG